MIGFVLVCGVTLAGAWVAQSALFLLGFRAATQAEGHGSRERA